MLDAKNIELKIKDDAKEALEKKIKPGQVVLLALMMAQMVILN